MNRRYRDISELPAELPVFPLAGCLLLPRAELPLNIFEPRYLALVDAALASNRLIGIIQPLPDAAGGGAPPLCSVGCAGRIVRLAETGDGRYFVSLEGVCRFRIGAEAPTSAPFRSFEVAYRDFARDLEEAGKLGESGRNAVIKALRAYAESNAIGVDWEAVSKATDETLINSLSIMSPFGMKEKQALLEAGDLQARSEVLVAIAEMELAGGGAGRAPLH